MLDVGNQTALTGSAMTTGIAGTQVIILSKVQLSGEGISCRSVVAVHRSDLEMDVRRTESSVIVSAGEDGGQTVTAVIVRVDSCATRVV